MNCERLCKCGVLPALSTADVFCQPAPEPLARLVRIISLKRKNAQHLTLPCFLLHSLHLSIRSRSKHSTRRHTIAQHGLSLASTPASPLPCRYGPSGYATYHLLYSHSTTSYTPKKPMRRFVKSSNCPTIPHPLLPHIYRHLLVVMIHDAFRGRNTHSGSGVGMIGE